MTHHPPGNTAPHLPADLYRQAQATGQPIVIVHQAPTTRPTPTRYLVPLGIALAATVGVIGLVAALLALIEFAAHTAALLVGTAGPIGVGGITLKLARSKTK
ncbi:hypothetical protein [Wenjunlia tyrosinilytica]|uniref:Uncharacterized protein n=1 Tax=Wenjunlia tyrosinilytica TaxID=1544741 RepID=A0A917ZZE7_9ACTN|nr:hypothetical protein [Wenjunlia tyrosinilytica]GGP01207.1 hypothetical protein GCM10012280_71600 [Wenjunlia tyrosinilytica]